MFCEPSFIRSIAATQTSGWAHLIKRGIFPSTETKNFYSREGCNFHHSKFVSAPSLDGQRAKMQVKTWKKKRHLHNTLKRRNPSHKCQNKIFNSEPTVKAIIEYFNVLQAQSISSRSLQQKLPHPNCSSCSSMVALDRQREG